MDIVGIARRRRIIAWGASNGSPAYVYPVELLNIHVHPLYLVTECSVYLRETQYCVSAHANRRCIWGAVVEYVARVGKPARLHTGGACVHTSVRVRT